MKNENIKTIDIEQLDTVSGGLDPYTMSLLTMWFQMEANYLWNEFMELIEGPQVSGPKTGLINCPFCGQPVHRDAFQEHMINNHSEDIIKNSPIC